MAPDTAVGSSPAFALTQSLQIEQQFRASGIAQVIVILKTPPTETPTTTTLATGIRSGAQIFAVDDLAKYFTDSPLSRDSALASAKAETATLSLGRRTGSSMKASESPKVRLYPHLGVMLGNVTREGLTALRHEGKVAAVIGTPEFSLIRPHLKSLTKSHGKTTWGIEFLEVPMLWQQGITGKDVVVAHLETGVDGKHPALSKAIANFAQFDNLGNEVTPSPAPFDSGEHGTHTAATIAGRRAKGVTMGVAPEAKLVSAMVIEGGNVIARVLNGLNWALANNAKVLSMSLGIRGWMEDWVPIIQLLRTRGSAARHCCGQ